MKLLSSSFRFQNNRQAIVFMVGFVQVLVLLLALVFMQCKRADTATAVKPASNEMVSPDTTKNEAYRVDSTYVPIASYHSEEVKQKLKNLENLHFSKGAIAYQVLDYLKAGENDMGAEFKFIELQFKDKSAEIIERLSNEIPDLANIMLSFPNLKFKLLVYTDDKGDEKKNEKLTQERGLAVQARLVKAGVSADRIMIKAYGEKYPVGDNKTYDGQMLNNRIEMTILSK